MDLVNYLSRYFAEKAALVSELDNAIGVAQIAAISRLLTSSAKIMLKCRGNEMRSCVLQHLNVNDVIEKKMQRRN